MFYQIIKETLPALKELKESGVTKYIGFSALPFKTFKYILERY